MKLTSLVTRFFALHWTSKLTETHVLVTSSINSVLLHVQVTLKKAWATHTGPRTQLVTGCTTRRQSRESRPTKSPVVRLRKRRCNKTPDLGINLFFKPSLPIWPFRSVMEVIINLLPRFDFDDLLSIEFAMFISFTMTTCQQQDER